MKIIVTILLQGEEKSWMDLEIPLDMTTGELISIVVSFWDEEIDKEDVFFLEWKERGRWYRLEENHSVYECGLMDGAYLRLYRNQQSGFEQNPVNGWRSIFQGQLEESDTEEKEGSNKDAAYAWKLLK
jgi:hypothetical protein